MNIMFIMPRYHTNIYNWIMKLKEEGDTVNVVFYHNLKRNLNCPVKPVLINYSSLYLRLKKIFKIKCADSRCGVPDLKSLRATFKSISPDIVIIRDPVRIFSIFSIIIALYLKINILLYTQAPVNSQYNIIKRLVINFFLTFTGSYMISPIRGEGRIKKIKRFFYCPFITSVNQLKSESKKDEFKILMVGKYIPRKDHILLIEALIGLYEREKIHLTIIGVKQGKKVDEYYRKVEDVIKLNKLHDFITLEDPLPYEELQQAYLEYNLFVLPSRDEEVGVTVLEAMSRGLPVICSDTAGAADFIRDYRNGIVFKSDDKGSLRTALEYCVSDREKSMQMGRESIRIVKEYYDPDIFYRRLKILKDIFFE